MRRLAVVPVRGCRRGRGLELLLGNLRKAMEFRGLNGKILDTDELILVEADRPIEASKSLAKLSGVEYAGTVEVSSKEEGEFLSVAKRVARTLAWRGKCMSVRMEGEEEPSRLEDLKFLTEVELVGVLSDLGMKVRDEGEVVLRVFVGRKAGYFFYHTSPGFGGYPTGYRGRALVLLAGERGLKSALLAIRAGFEVELATAEPRAREAIRMASELSDHYPEGLRLFVVRALGCDPVDALFDFACERAREGPIPIPDSLGFESLSSFEERGVPILFMTLHLTEEEAGRWGEVAPRGGCGHEVLELYVGRGRENECFNELERFRARAPRI